MLIENFLPSLIEAALFCVYNHGLQDVLCDWMPGAETWQMCTKCNDHCSCRNAQLASEEKKNAEDSHNLVVPRSSSQLSAISIMSESSAPNLVYKRRKLRENSVTILSARDLKNPRTGDYLSFINSDAPSLAAKEQYDHSQKRDQNGPCLCTRESDVLKSQSFYGEELVTDEAPKASVPKVLEVDSVNDSCSSSKSNMENVSTSIKTEVDETGECSSSSAIVMEAVGDLSEKDLCISILRSHGLLGEVRTTRICGSAEDINTSSSKSCRQSCKICNRSETALKMLICDDCEEAFHMSCCQPRIKKVPIDEWFCHSCLRKKHTSLKERVTRKFPNITSVMSRNASSKDEVNPILLMLRDTEPYRTSVRVGKGFQAEVHDWSGPINNDGIGEPLELHTSGYARLHELNSSKPSKFSSISNWIQCQEVVDRENGIICGKWRRAPLFEVQTDDWECFCSILWDPSHADCNVPQEEAHTSLPLQDSGTYVELETDKVLKQLKYIETLRPRLSAKQHNLDRANSTGDLQNDRIGTKSIQTL